MHLCAYERRVKSTDCTFTTLATSKNFLKKRAEFKRFFFCKVKIKDLDKKLFFVNVSDYATILLILSTAPFIYFSLFSYIFCIY